MLAHSSSSPKLGRDMPVACRAEHVGWLGTRACEGGGVCVRVLKKNFTPDVKFCPKITFSIYRRECFRILAN